jgi:hypothetical protein
MAKASAEWKLRESIPLPHRVPPLREGHRPRDVGGTGPRPCGPPLLADEDHAVSEAYGVWVEKSFAGKKYMGVERSTFVIGPDGTLEKVMRRVKPDTHADEVLAALAG